jgi:hypothetical protein
MLSPTRSERFCQRIKAVDPTAYELGIERSRSDMMQIGGLLCILGIGAVHSALAMTSIIIDGGIGLSQINGFKLPVLVSTLIQVMFGMYATLVGFSTLVATPISDIAHTMARILAVVVNLGPIAFILVLIRLVEGAMEGPAYYQFIPDVLSPTQLQVYFVVAMGIVGMVSVRLSLTGGLTCLALGLNAHLGGQGVDMYRRRFVIRLAYFSLLQVIGGFSQFALGVFLAASYGWGPYSQAVHVLIYTVFFPSLAIFVGASQILWGMYGFARAVGWVKIRSRDDNRFMLATLVTWLVTMILQVIVQPAYGGGMAFLAEIPAYAAVYIPSFVMPAWLEYMLRVSPDRIDPSYYSLPENRRCKQDLLCWIFGITEAQLPIDETSTGSLARTDSSASLDLEQQSD